MTFLSILGTLLYYLAIALFLESTFNYFMYEDRFNNSQANPWDFGLDRNVDQASNQRASVNAKKLATRRALSQEEGQVNTKKRVGQQRKRPKVQKENSNGPRARLLEQRAKVEATEPFPDLDYIDPFLCLGHSFWEENPDWEDVCGYTERRQRADSRARYAARHMAWAFAKPKSNSTTRWKPPATSWISRVPSTSFYLKTLNKHPKRSHKQCKLIE